MKLRAQLPEDDEKAKKARILLYELIAVNDSIEGGIWISIFLDMVARSIYYSKVSHEDYCEALDEAKRFYKFLWEAK
jgi:hypothetical protein